MFEIPDDQKPTIRMKVASRKPTLIGLMATAVPSAVAEEIRTNSTAELLLPIRYRCTLRTSNGVVFEARIITHMSIEDYCELHNLNLISLDFPAEIARAGETTVIG